MAQTTSGNGPDDTSPPAETTAAQLIINAQYIKDLSFENPHAPQTLMQPPTTPAVEINVDVRAQPLNPETFEVVLTIKAGAKTQTETLFLVELVYGAVVTARNLTQEMMPAVLLVETPRIMFPFARNIIADATRDGGYPPLMINPIEFSELLRRRDEMNAAGPTATA
jgi:preprotein translocase subunit SecB